MDFKLSNDIDRKFYKQDFTPINKLLKIIRKSLANGEKAQIKDLELENIIEFIPKETAISIYLFQAGIKYIRWCSRRATLEDVINRNIEKLRENKNFQEFDIKDENKCRILIELAIDRKRSEIKKITTSSFTENRFEIGIHGIELRKDNEAYYYMPQEAIIQSHLEFRSVMNYLISKTPLAKTIKDSDERYKIVRENKEYEMYLFRSRAFITYKDKCIPLYRGNMLFDKFSLKITKDLIVNTTDYMLDYMEENGKFLYYYDCKEDSRKDHEHPKRPENDLYYNEIRHIGAIIAILKVYENFKQDKKYLSAAKKALEWILTITYSHETEFGKSLYTYLNKKVKLGSVGLALAAFVYYRKITNDKSYDEYIKGYARHILSRVESTGEFLQYYINPSIQEGKPILKLTKEEKKQTYQFYYPGEALLGLALFYKYFKDDKELAEKVKEISNLALDYMVDVRPSEYAELFPALPSDAWLMQAVNEWCDIDGMTKENCIKFVFQDAETMMEKMYKKDDSPYIDYEGGYYYNYGDHYYPDGARSEGLIAAYYLAKRKKDKTLEKRILDACKIAAKNQYQIYNSREFCYAHKNPEKAYRGVRLKVTRQWTRIDMAWHVSMFFMSLYHALKQEK